MSPASPGSWAPRRALVYGLAVAGTSTVRALRRRGADVVVADDAVDAAKRDLAAELDVDLVERPDDAELRRLLAACDLFAPAPGVPETHRAVALALDLGIDTATEIELAHRWERERAGGPRPMLAVTGTDGKTTTTLMTVAMLRAAGVRTVDAGNTATPLVDAIEDDLDVLVVECASFRLAFTPTFRPDAGAWLNLAPDHLNWHRSLESYAATKARIWANQRPDDVAVGFRSDPTVMRHLATAPGRRVTFGAPDADYRVAGGELTGPRGTIGSVDGMRRALPHDVTNALAASALVLETGLADENAIATALASFTGPPHRIEHLGTAGGVAWYNDSKATTPHAAAVAIRGLDRIVLIAGGKDKHVDLGEMTVDADRVDAVIAIGETRQAVADAFRRARPSVEVTELDSLDDAVAHAATVARPGQTVLLSPGCASLDQFPSFEVRGDRFRELARSLAGLTDDEAQPAVTPSTPPAVTPSTPPAPTESR